MASQFARAARRLSQAGIRGLGDALKDAGAASSSGRQLAAAQRPQPWALTSLRAHAAAGGSSDEGEPAAGMGPSSGSSSAGLQPGLEEASKASSSRAAQEAAAVAAAATAARVRPPPGHTDFQQRQLLMLFTCTRCNTRAGKAFSKQSYEQGVVIVECPGCNSKHLIADHLGWFGQKGTVEEFAAERGRMVVRKAADGTVELTPEDLLGASLVAEAEAAAAASASSAASAAAAGEQAAASLPDAAAGGAGAAPGGGA